jgi:glutamine synthetase
MVPNCATTEDLLKAIKDEKVQMIDLRFTDLPGVWQHFSVPPSAVNANTDLPRKRPFLAHWLRLWRLLAASSMARVRRGGWRDDRRSCAAGCL